MWPNLKKLNAVTCSLYNMREINAHGADQMSPFLTNQFENHCKDSDKIWHRRYVTTGYRRYADLTIENIKIADAQTCKVEPILLAHNVRSYIDIRP